MKQPLVSIACLTFNHEKYINEAMDSFLCQETDFDFEIVVGDGGSTDKNRTILKGYQDRFGQDKIRLLFPDKDPGIGGMLNQIFLNCRGKYIAVCEGDDFWLTEDKLKKQITCLEENPECVLVHSDISFVNEEGKNRLPNQDYENLIAKRRSGDVFNYMLENGNFIYTPTVCFRRDALPELVLQKKDTWFLFDYWYWLIISLHGKFQFQDRKTAAYRLHDKGATSQSDFFNKKYRAVHIDVLVFSLKNYSSISKEKLRTLYVILRGTKGIVNFHNLLIKFFFNRPILLLPFLGFVTKHWLKKINI